MHSVTSLSTHGVFDSTPSIHSRPMRSGSALPRVPNLVLMTDTRLTSPELTGQSFSVPAITGETLTRPEIVSESFTA